MKANKALEIITKALSKSGSADLTLEVMIYRPGGIGGTPTEVVEAIVEGFDWDHGKLLVKTEKQLSALSSEEVSAIMESVRRGSSWHAYKAQENLREQNKKLQAQVIALNEEIALLKKGI